MRWIVVALAGCTASGTVGGATGTGTGSTTESGEPVADGAAVIDLPVSQVAIYQGVQIDLMVEGEAPEDGQAPIVADREALVRVFVEPPDDFDSRKVTAVLRVDGGKEHIVEDTFKVETSSDETDLDSTFNFSINAAWMSPGMTMSLELRESGEAGGGDAEVWSDEETPFDVEKGDAIEVVLIPIEYNADGSGRLPDLSDDQIALYQEWLVGTYPAEDVVVSIGDTLPWDDRIAPFDGNDWGDLLTEISQLRSQADVPDNTYFYGLFNADDSLAAFCGGGCILGLSQLGGPQDVWSRASIGIGFSGATSAETMVHEVGHAHGRDHAPCGLYGQPADPQFPHDDGSLGVVGYDIVSGDLIAPTRKDMMSYCEPIWVSDYTYAGLFQRIETLADDAKVVGASRWTAFQQRADGTMVPAFDVVQPTSGGHLVDVEAVDADGVSRRVVGHFHPYPDLPGGMVLLPADGVTWASARVLATVVR